MFNIFTHHLLSSIFGFLFKIKEKISLNCKAPEVRDEVTSTGIVHFCLKVYYLIYCLWNKLGFHMIGETRFCKSFQHNKIISIKIYFIKTL